MADVKVTVCVWWSIVQDERLAGWSFTLLPGVEVVGASLQVFCPIGRRHACRERRFRELERRRPGPSERPWQVRHTTAVSYPTV